MVMFIQLIRSHTIAIVSVSTKPCFTSLMPFFFFGMYHGTEVRKTGIPSIASSASFDLLSKESTDYLWKSLDARASI